MRVGSRAWSLQPHEPQAVLSNEGEDTLSRSGVHEVSAGSGPEEAFSRDGFAAWGSRASTSHTRGRR